MYVHLYLALIKFVLDFYHAPLRLLNFKTKNFRVEEWRYAAFLYCASFALRFLPIAQLLS